jgi:hypothetical protein
MLLFTDNRRVNMEMEDKEKKIEGKKKNKEEKKEDEEEWTIDNLLGFGKFHYFQVWIIQTVIAFLGRQKSNT